MTDIVLQRAAPIIENIMSNQQWQNEDFVIALRKIGAEIGDVKPKLVLKILRQALTGMKVCSIYIISRILQLKLLKGWTTTCRDCPPNWEGTNFEAASKSVSASSEQHMSLAVMCILLLQFIVLGCLLPGSEEGLSGSKCTPQVDHDRTAMNLLVA